MKSFVSAFALVLGLLTLGAPTTVQAQIECGLQLHHDKLLPYQRIRIDVIVKNRGPRLLNFQEAGERARIEFIVKNHSGKTYKRTKAPLLRKVFIIHPQDTARTTVDLQSAFSITAEGNYEVTARFVMNGRRYLSKTVFFDIEDGTEVDKLEIFKPARVFRLMELTRDDGFYLFLGVYAPKEKMVYGVYDLGRMAQSYRPQMEVDGRGNLHVLHAAEPDRFMHSSFTSQGAPLTQAQHAGEYGTPSLRVNPAGSARVINSRPLADPRFSPGGERRR